MSKQIQAAIVEQIQTNIDLYRHALLAITKLAGDQVPTQEQIFAGLSYYAQMSFDLAPNTDIAQRTIELGIEYGKQLSEEPDDPAQ